jgi:SMP-30/Gluconolactonase/LRE-like region
LGPWLPGIDTGAIVRRKEHLMKPRRDLRAVAAAAALALVALCGTLPRLGAYQDPQPGTLILVAGTGETGFSGDNGPATAARLNSSHDILADAAGNRYIADTFNHRVRKIRPDGIILTVAGTGEPGFSGDNGPATAAKLRQPEHVAVDPAGSLYFSDTGNHRVRRVNLDGTLTTVAGTGKEGFSGDNGPATAARLSTPTGLALDPAGNLYVAEYSNGRIRRVSPDGTIITVAGGGKPADRVGDGGPATAASLEGPSGLTIDITGSLLIAERPVGRVRKVTPDGVITTVAGARTGGSPVDGGPATAGQLKRPYDVAVDIAGNLFITESFSHRVRKVDPEGIITTVAGTGEIGFSGAGGPATAARLNDPSGVAVDAAGNLFITTVENPDEHVLMVVRAAAPGLLAGRPFPNP